MRYDIIMLLSYAKHSKDPRHPDLGILYIVYLYFQWSHQPAMNKNNLLPDQTCNFEGPNPEAMRQWSSRRVQHVLILAQPHLDNCSMDNGADAENTADTFK